MKYVPPIIYLETKFHILEYSPIGYLERVVEIIVFSLFFVSKVLMRTVPGPCRETAGRNGRRRYKVEGPGAPASKPAAPLGLNARTLLRLVQGALCILDPGGVDELRPMYPTLGLQLRLPT